MARPVNPIIVAVERDFRGRRPTVVLGENGKPILGLIIDVGGESRPPTSQRKWFQVGVSLATLADIGVRVYTALLTGDETIVKDVKGALKQASKRAQVPSLTPHLRRSAAFEKGVDDYRW